MPSFISRESFLLPRVELRPHLQNHRAWVEGLRQHGVRISTGSLVVGEGKRGGGGLLLEPVDFASAEALIRQAPMLLSGGVRRSLPHKARSCPQASPTSASTAATSPSLR